MHHFVAIGEFKLELQSGNAQSGSNSTIFRAVWPWNFTSSYVNSNWSYSPETAKWGRDLCDLDLWPWPFAWTLRRSLVITPENVMMIRWWEHSQKGVTDRRTDRRTDGQTENTICRAAWSQLKIVTRPRYYNGRGRPISRPNVEMNCNDIFMRHIFWSTWNVKVIAQSPVITAPQREEMADCWGQMLRKKVFHGH